MDSSIRLAAFQWLNEQNLLYDSVLPRRILGAGFLYQNRPVHLISPQGIFTPRGMDLPLTITTSPGSRYFDKPVKEGIYEYSYRGSDIHHRDNQGLRECMKQRKPLIYFVGIDPGWYFAIYPVYIIRDNPERLIFTVQADSISQLSAQNLAEDKEATHWRRAYATINAEIRLHQQKFRFRVLTAYQEQCALCRLRHRELLDAAHIIGDKEEAGDPVVQNGLALCKIHHAAFDKNILGIHPDFHIHVRKDILTETDGPMLRYGLQALENQKIILPPNKRDYPDKNRLEERFSQFLKAS